MTLRYCRRRPARRFHQVFPHGCGRGRWSGTGAHSMGETPVAGRASGRCGDRHICLVVFCIIAFESLDGMWLFADDWPLLVQSRGSRDFIRAAQRPPQRRDPRSLPTQRRGLRAVDLLPIQGARRHKHGPRRVDALRARAGKARSAGRQRCGTGGLAPSEHQPHSLPVGRRQPSMPTSPGCSGLTSPCEDLVRDPRDAIRLIVAV